MPTRSASPTPPYRAARLAVALLLLAAGAAAEGADPPAPSGAEASEPDQKFGLSEAQRKDVFVELADAEKRAEREAAQKFQARPESEAQAVLTDELLKRYRAAIGKAHGLSEQQLVEIQAEGYRKSWRVVLE